MSMARTNIDIDEEACRRVMERFNLTTMKDAVNLALRTLAIEPMTLEEALAMRGTGWEGDLAAMRTPRS
jgi:Arc/MetJ family transcription regulator